MDNINMWHDLIIDPNDLPLDKSRWVLIKFQGKDSEPFYTCWKSYLVDAKDIDDCIYFKWKYIEED